MKDIRPENELLSFEKLIYLTQIVASICLGISYFLPLYTSSNGEINHADGNWGMFFWTIPALVIIHLSTRWFKTVLCFLSALGGLFNLFLVFFLANYKSTPLIGYHIAQISIIILIISWLTLSVTTLKTAKIQKVKTEQQAQIEKRLRYILLGGGIVYIIYQLIGMAVLTRNPEGDSINYELPSGYHWVYSQYRGYMHMAEFEDRTPSFMANGSTRPLIMIVSIPSYIKVNEEKIRLKVQLSEEELSNRQSCEMKLVDEEEVIIRGQQVLLLIYEGTDENNVQIRQVVSRLFEGKNSKVMLFIKGRVENWNQEEINTFITSIK